MEKTALFSQEHFVWLSIPDQQHVGFMQESLDQCDCEPLLRSGSSGSSKSDAVAEQQPSYTPVNYISDEARAMLQAYENAAMRRADASASASGYDATCHESMSNTLMYDPERILANPTPPKRFFRTFWQSLTIRMLRLEKGKAKCFKRTTMIE